MEKINLSLKSVYKLLMTNDFPIYSESVIDEKNRKGQTLLKFWHSLVISEFRSGSCGQIIWKNDGKRNRYISNLCNRNPEMKLYLEYAKELASQISAVTLLDQVRKFSAFLLGKKYKHDILLRRIQELIRLSESDDPHVSNEITSQIKNTISWENSDSNKSLFQASYLLTVLMLYAAAGEAMDDSVMDVLRKDAYSISALWDIKLNPPTTANTSVTYLTEHVCILQDNPLPHQRFFGREEELFNLKEMAVQGRKCLITGVGGVGKTELLRQLIQSCEGEKSIDCIAIVPYTAGIVESFGKVFPDFWLQDAEESFNHILYQLEKKAAGGRRVLLLIDNMNNSLEDDPALSRLASLSCAVLISSRRLELEGFETYRICEPSVSTCSLIFRDNYGKPLTQEDRTVLNELLHNGFLRHPLTLRLMAIAAHSNDWSVQQLKDHLEQNHVSLTWVEDDRVVKLDQVYHRLYSYMPIPDSCQKLVELFTLLPRDIYSLEFLEDVFESITAGDDLAHGLRLLAEGGWLDETDNGYTMHPLIAQCLRRKVLTEDRINSFLQCLYQKIPKFSADMISVNLEPNRTRICSIASHIFGQLTGSISPQLMEYALCAFSGLCPSLQVKQQCKAKLRHMMKRCTHPNDQLELHMCMIEAAWQIADVAIIERIYEKQNRQLTVPYSEFIDFCLLAASGSTNNLRSNTDLAIKILNQVLDSDALPNQKARAYEYLASSKRLGSLYEDALRYGEEMVAYLKLHPECDTEIQFMGRYNLCASYLEFHRAEEAAKLLSELHVLLKSSPSPIFRMYYCDVAGYYEMNFGSPEKALVYLEEGTSLIFEYYGADINYCQQLNKMCILLQRLNRYDEALDKYHIVIDHARNLSEPGMLMVYSNNLGVLYLDLEQAEKAKVVLEPILGIARQAGGVSQGECVKNMARAHGLLGEYAKERECLSEAVPLLEAAYGPEHPRAVAARQRYEELKNQK